MGLRSVGRREERATPTGLGRRSRRVVRAFCEALLADSDARGQLTPAPAELVQRVVGDFDVWVGATSAPVRHGLRIICEVVNALPPVVTGTLARMTHLTLAERISYLRALESGRLPMATGAVVALKVPLAMLAYEQGPLLALTGFDRASLKTPGPRRSKKPGEHVRRHKA